MYRTKGTFAVLLVSLAAAWGRDTSKAFRSMPAISNSLVNLGKMDISFHFNDGAPDGLAANNVKPEHYTHSASPFYVPKTEHTVDIEPCPCNTIKNFRNPFMNSPAELINMILKTNDLFSYNQEPTISTICCESHEHVHEDVYFEFSPNSHVETKVQTVPASGFQPFPMMLNSILPKKLSTDISKQPKALEIFFFPKSKDGKLDFSKILSPKEKKAKKSDIQIVGDKDLREDFKKYKYRPTFPLTAKTEIEIDKERFASVRLKPKKKEESKPAPKVKEDATEGDSTTPTASTVNPSNFL